MSGALLGTRNVPYGVLRIGEAMFAKACKKVLTSDIYLVFSMCCIVYLLLLLMICSPLLYSGG